jgi:hypothetical protein
MNVFALINAPGQKHHTEYYRQNAEHDSANHINGVIGGRVLKSVKTESGGQETDNSDQAVNHKIHLQPTISYPGEK